MVPYQRLSRRRYFSNLHRVTKAWIHQLGVINHTYAHELHETIVKDILEKILETSRCYRSALHKIAHLDPRHAGAEPLQHRCSLQMQPQRGLSGHCFFLRSPPPHNGSAIAQPLPRQILLPGAVVLCHSAMHIEGQAMVIKVALCTLYLNTASSLL